MYLSIHIQVPFALRRNKQRKVVVSCLGLVEDPSQVGCQLLLEIIHQDQF
jgi:hypothetical protein